MPAIPEPNPSTVPSPSTAMRIRLRMFVLLGLGSVRAPAPSAEGARALLDEVGEEPALPLVEHHVDLRDGADGGLAERLDGHVVAREDVSEEDLVEVVAPDRARDVVARLLDLVLRAEAGGPHLA